MHIRLAEEKDLPRLAFIGATAFASDLIYGHFYPLRSIYPQDFQRSILNTLRRLMITPGGVMVVAELSNDELVQVKDQAAGFTPGESKVVGYMTLVRYGTAESIATWSPDSSDKQLRRKLLDNEESEFQDRSAKRDVMEDFYQEEQRIIGHVPERIDARTLAILPEFQRMGIGKKFLKYLFDRSNEDGVPIFADASKKGISLYLAMGFQIIGTVKLRANTVQVLDNVENSEGSKAITLEAMDVPIIAYYPSARSRLGSQL